MNFDQDIFQDMSGYNNQGYKADYEGQQTQNPGNYDNDYYQEDTNQDQNHFVSSRPSQN